MIKNEKALSDLREITKIQCSNGNWNYDAYMHGLANGLIMALATMEGTEPAFLSAPKEWLRDRPSPEPLTCQSEPAAHQALCTAIERGTK